MERRQKVDGKWYENLQFRHKNTLKPSMIPNLSRPSSQASRLQDQDWTSISHSRSLSRLSSSNCSPNASFSFKKRRQSNVDIEDILSKHQIVRPRSVSLVKYDPLPAINSDSPKSGSRSEGSDSNSFDHSLGSLQRLSNNSSISPIEEKDVEPLPEDPELENATPNALNPDHISPPQLIRSRTFDVIETNLDNLPVIDDSGSQNSQDDDENAVVSFENEDDLDLKPNVEVKINVDGLSLNSFLTQTEEEQSGHFSLVTHPASPSHHLMSEGLPEGDEDESGADITNNNSDLSDILNDNEKSLENQLLVRLPDSQPVDMNFNLDITLQELLSSLQMLEWEEKRLRIVEDVEDKHLSEPLSKLHFNSSTQVYLVPDT